MAISQHPINVRIRELIDSSGEATDADVHQIIEHLSNAPFNPDVVTVAQHVGLVHQGRRLSARDDSLFFHLIQRVLVESQWQRDVTEGQYLTDLRTAIRHPNARLALYRRRGGAIASIIVATEEVVPVERLGTGALPWLIVVYSADRGILISGYQFSGLQELRIPEGALWLK